MQITKTDVDSLNATLSIKLEPADYNPKVDTALKTQAKKANIKGFRPGTVPVALIKKMYGKSILADEINKIINDSIYGYLKDNNIDILGNPLPSLENRDQADFDNPGEMEFFFDLGLAPQFNINLSEISIPYYNIKVDDKMLDQHIADLTRRHGNLENVETSGEKDMLMVTFNELKEDGTIKEGGVFHNSTVAIEYIENAETKNKLIGLKVGDKLTADPKKLSHNESDMAAMLGVGKDALDDISQTFQLTVTEIRRMHEAELNQELFDKVYGPGTVTTIDDFKAKVKDELEKNFAGDSHNFFHREARITLINKLHIELPDIFLKRWIMATSEKPIDPHELEHEFDHYADDLRWQLIESKIMRERGLKIERADIIENTKENLRELYVRYNLPMLDDEALTKHAESILAKKEEVQNAIQKTTTRKVINAIKEHASIQYADVTFDVLMEKYKELQKREHAHHAHSHAHEHAH
ncbi:MAG TPA: trigger factor [Flavobacteriales bacterium]|nr:trigger factor [Flavobacteriales bacterium]